MKYIDCEGDSGTGSRFKARSSAGELGHNQNDL